MIDAEAIRIAEQMLQLTYQGAEQMPRQLTDLEVDKDAFANWLKHRVGRAMRSYYRDYKSMNPQLEAAYNTLLMHFFLVGLAAGRRENLNAS